MEKASFSLEDYKFIKVELDFSDFKPSSLELSIDPKGVFNMSDSNYELEFTFKAFSRDKDSNEPKQVVLVNCLATFKFNQVTKLEDIPTYFYANSIAILFPYVRAFISTLSLQANITPIVLPTMNLSSLQEKLKVNTKEV